MVEFYKVLCDPTKKLKVSKNIKKVKARNNCRDRGRVRFEKMKSSSEE